MADERPPADTAEAPKSEDAPDGAYPRWRRVLTVAVPLFLALGIAAAVFAIWMPTPGVSEPSPGVSPSASPSTSSTPSTTPTGQPTAPTDKPPVAIEDRAAITPGLIAEISSVEAVDGTARGPGEVAGPSLRVTVTFSNSTATDAPLNTAVVSAYFGADRTPAPELRGPGGSPLPAMVATGDTATGVYIFTVPEAERRNVTIMVDYSVDVDPLVFQGDIASLINR